MDEIVKDKVLLSVLKTIKDAPQTKFVGVFSWAKQLLIKYGFIIIKPDLSCELTAEGQAVLGE